MGKKFRNLTRVDFDLFSTNAYEIKNVMIVLYGYVDWEKKKGCFHVFELFKRGERSQVIDSIKLVAARRRQALAFCDAQDCLT